MNIKLNYVDIQQIKCYYFCNDFQECSPGTHKRFGVMGESSSSDVQIGSNFVDVEGVV